MTPLHTTLIHAVTRYDRRQQELSERNPRRYYNVYALAQYLEGVDTVEWHMSKGLRLVDALYEVFLGQLLCHLLKAVSDKPSKTA